jgi:GntR family transcriptional regulator, transcriptional repressor for pyruvate dehydrogenase complex
MTSSESPPVHRRPLVDQVLGYLQQQIASGVFPVGSKLPPEPELMLQLSVGRSTLREAMRVLVHMGLVDVRPGDGTYVRAASLEMEPLGQRLQRAKVIEVYEVRRTLELECVRLAALRRDEEDLVFLRNALRDRRAFLAPGCEQAFIDADLAFHVALACATKNTVLADLYRVFVKAHRTSWEEAGEVSSLKEQGQILHEQIAEAIARRDPDRAAQLLELMLEQSTDRFHEIIHQEDQTGRTFLEKGS